MRFVTALRCLLRQFPRHGAGNGELHGGMQSMTFYPITGVGALQAGQTLAGWAVVALFLLALAVV